jgi:prophage regulatory protein
MNNNATLHQVGSPSLLPSRRLLSVPDVVALSGLSRATIYRRIADKSLKAPLRISPRRTGWLIEDIEEWIAGMERTK